MNLYDLSQPSKKKKPQLIKESQLAEFAPGGGGGPGDYLKALASAWYNGTFDSGSLQKGIKSQEDVERLLNRGIVCPDGKTRKLHIDYNSDFDGVEIYSDDYYEHGDLDGNDGRTGQPWGPYDHMEFKDEELDESVAEATGDQNFDSMMSRMTAEPKYPDQDMPPTSIAELIQWADRNNKPYHEYFAQWARRNGFKNVNDALVWFGDNVDPSNPWGPKDFLDPFGRPAAEELEDAAKHDPKAAELMKVFRCYEEIVFDWPDEYRQMNMPVSRKGTDEGVAEGTGPVKHRISLTVTDPNHPMVSKRGETIQKTVRVPGDDREKAINSAIAHYRRKGYKVHDHHYIGIVEEGLADEFMKMAREKGYNPRLAGTPEQERERTQQMLAQRAKDRAEQERQSAQADAAKLPELKAEYEQMKKEYQSLGGSNWQYADREQNLSDAERKARSMEPALRDLAGKIHRAEQAGVAEAGYMHGFADPNAPSLGSRRRGDNEGNSEFDDRIRRQTGMIFYDVDDVETARAIGLQQTRTGKWYLRPGNRHAQQTADRAFGMGRIWYPKNETVEQENLGELSNELLGRYKKELGLRATAADRAGDYDKGHEYFKKITRATLRQGENDARRHAEKENDIMETRLNMMRKAGYNL